MLLYAVFSDEFKKQKNKIKDQSTLKKLKKTVESILDNPEKGKYLKNKLKGKKSVRIKPFRLIFEPKQTYIVFHTFEHRERAYK